MDTAKVRRFIKEYSHRLWGAESLATELDVSIETLRKRFRRTEGISIYRFIVLSKVEHAKRLLNETEKCCLDVCLEAGFARQDDASRTFKRITGMTMEEYRSSCRKRRS